MNLPRYALKNQTVTITGMALAIVWGLIVFYTIPRNEDPVCHLRSCVVTAVWPGATAKKVEQLITIPLEQALIGLDEVRQIRSESQSGLSVVYVDLEQRGIRNLEEVWTKVRNKVADVQLPEGVMPARVDSEYGSVEAMVLALYPVSPAKYSHEDLRKLAKQVKSELNTIPYMGRVDLHGVQEEVIQLEVPAGVWSKLEIATDELAYTLQERNIVAPGGSLDTKLGRFFVRLTGEFETEKQIEQVVLASLQKAAPTYLKDLGIQVKRDYVQPPVAFCRYSEQDFTVQKCVIISFTMKRDGNIVELGEAVHKKLQEIPKKIPGWPEDVKLTVVCDQPHYVKQTTDTFISNLISSIYAVVGIGLLLSGLRMALIMAMGVPLVLIGSLGMFVFFGVDLEQVSISALIVALGMLVDNGIEVSENIQRLMLEGYSRFEACWRGAHQIGMSILSATLTTVAAFLPMITIPAEEGEYVYSLPVVVSITLILSWIIAMMVTTILCYWLIKPTVIQGGILAFIVRIWIAFVAIYSRLRRGGEIVPFVRRLWGWVLGRAPIEPGEEHQSRLKNAYIKILEYCLKHRYKTVILGMGGSIFCLFLFGDLVGKQFFPLAFRDQFIIEIWLPASVPITRTDEVCKEVERIIYKTSPIVEGNRKVERFRSMLSFIGKGAPRFYISIDPYPEMHNFAHIIVNTTAPQYTDGYIADLRKELERTIAGARISVKKLNLGTSTGSPIALHVAGSDPAKMRVAAQDLKKCLAQHKDVIEIYDDWGNPIYQVEIDVDHDLANLAGVTNKDVARTMNTFLSGQYLTAFREDDHTIPVYLRLPKGERDSVGALHNFYVAGRMGRIPIDGISDIKVAWTEAKIVRRDQELMMTVYANAHENALPIEVVRDILPQLEEIEKNMPAGCRLEIGGEWQDTKESDKNFNFAFNISMLLICLILVVQYNSLLKPVIVLLTLPMAFAGSMMGLYITGWPLNFMAILGMVSLAGVVVNAAIVMIDFTDAYLREGVPLYEAIVKTARIRLIPIFLTAFTTVGGFVSLALNGGPMWEPMANVFIYGLLSATFLTLLIIPCVYYILGHDFKIKLIKPPIEEGA